MTKPRVNLRSLGLKGYSSLNVNSNARMPMADVTNAPELFGDIFGDIDDGDIEDGDVDYGDFEDGDFEEGDVDYGDMTSPDNDNLPALFKMISGDIEQGGLDRRRFKRGMAIGAGLSAAALAAQAAAKARKKKKMRNRSLLMQKLQVTAASQTLKNQRMLRQQKGKILRTGRIPFFGLIGAKMNQSPIDPMESFPADMLKQALDRMNSDTPFYQETAIGTYSAGTWTAVTTGVATNRFFAPLILQLGINALSGVPGTIFQITATIPTINGTLTISSTPFTMTIENKFDVRFIMYPWQLVSNKALFLLGQYSSSNAITFAVTGLPAASAVNLVVPGSLHPWIVTLRNRLI